MQVSFSESWQCKCLSTVVTKIDWETFKCNGCEELYKDKYPRSSCIVLEPNYKKQIIKFFGENTERFKDCRDMDLMSRMFQKWLREMKTKAIWKDRLWKCDTCGHIQPIKTNHTQDGIGDYCGDGRTHDKDNELIGCSWSKATSNTMEIRKFSFYGEVDMSCVTGILIFYSPCESMEERVMEINEFNERHQFVNADLSDVEPKKWGGGKHSQFFFIGGGFNYINLDDFLIHLRCIVNWEYPEDVQIIYQQEHDDLVTLKGLNEILESRHES